ncbi:MAG: hypothetical protein HFE73_11400 [Firmicutes bacterium]|nr:hypothetical protein [Bacillota bacterium]
MKRIERCRRCCAVLLVVMMVMVLTASPAVAQETNPTPDKSSYTKTTYRIDTEIRGAAGTITGAREVVEGDTAVVTWAVADPERYEVKYVLVDGEVMPELRTLSEVTLLADKDHKVTVIIDQKSGTTVPTNPIVPPTNPTDPTDPEIPVQGQVTLKDGIVKTGNTIQIPIVITENQGIASLKLNLEYDKTALQLVNTIAGDGFDGEVFKRISQDASDILVWQTEKLGTNVNGTGTLAILEFQAPEDAQTGDYTIKITCDSDNTLTADGEEKTFTCTDGVVTVVDFIYGDVNDSSDVNINDADLVAKYVAGWAAYQNINLDAADVDLNGKVTLRDAAIISRHVAGWEGYENMPNTADPLPLPGN